jgi:16S rRNA (uracil1498-N3)-methyltransferase
MKLQRFYIKERHNKYGDLPLAKVIWLHEDEINHQLLKVFRAKVGYQLVLFNDETERLYKIVEIQDNESIKLELVSELVKKLPAKKAYLLWAVLKKDKNDLVVQKATELGIHMLVPVLSERTEKQGLNVDRLDKIAKEAAEQCGRGDVPEIREPISLHEALEEYSDLPLFICEQAGEQTQIEIDKLETLGVLVGPEGGWTDAEKKLFIDEKLNHLVLSDFTLRAETAAIAAAAKMHD